MDLKLKSRIPSKSTAIVKGFSQLLATTYALYLKTQNFHWNVTGSTFPMLHTFFEGQYEALAEAVDLIAEQIRVLDHFVSASFQEFSKLSLIVDSIGRKNASQMINELSKDHRVVIQLLNELIK